MLSAVCDSGFTRCTQYNLQSMWRQVFIHTHTHNATTKSGNLYEHLAIYTVGHQDETFPKSRDHSLGWLVFRLGPSSPGPVYIQMIV